MPALARWAAGRHDYRWQVQPAVNASRQGPGPEATGFAASFTAAMQVD